MKHLEGVLTTGLEQGKEKDESATIPLLFKHYGRRKRKVDGGHASQR